MGLPKKRTSKQKRDQRRANWKLTPVNVSKCPQCQAPAVPHRVCAACGTYKGKQIVAAAE